MPNLPASSSPPIIDGSPARSGAPAFDPAPTAVRWARRWRIAQRLLQIGIPLAVAWLVWRQLHTLDVRDVRSSIADAPWPPIVLGLLAAFAAVGVMGLYDAVAFPRGANGTLTTARRWLLGSVLFGWCNFLSMGPIGGPAIRIIAYRRFGLTGPEITRGFVGHYISSSAGLLAWLLAAWLPGPVGVTGMVVRIAVALAVAVGLPLIARVAIVPLLRRHRYGTELDGIPLARLGLVAFFDWGLTLLSFTLLIGAVGADIGVEHAARTLFTGQFAGILSMTPGGLGSADAVWFKGFALGGVPHATAGAAVLVFRIGSYLLPWAASLLVIYIALARGSVRVRLWQRRVVAGAVMVNALLLLLSAATPALRDRLDALERVVPLGAIEVSHSLATVSAALMLLLVRGLLRGYRGACILTLALLVASAVAHPLKGGGYEESVVSLVLIGMLLGVRGAFTRPGRIPVGWELVLAAGVGASALFLACGFAAFDHLPFRAELWTTLREQAEASRFLRGGALLVLIAIAAAVRQALKPVSLWITPSADEIDRAEAFARAHADSAAPLLVGGGDKGVWFFEPEPGGPAGMVLHQRRGDQLIVLKDPVLAPGAEPPELIEALLRHAADLDVGLVFSMISTEWMGHLHEFGFHFLKINEEAVVPLTEFTLAGGRNAGFRRTIRDMEGAGITFEILRPPFDSATVDQLRTVSDAWIAAKGGHELQFSACCFSPAYIQRNPVGVARDASGRIVAFVSLLTTRPGGPATLDFMRYIPDIADNLMDFVIIRAMQVVAGEGAASFSLGGAPLSDVGIIRGSRIVERCLHLFSIRAERIFNYRGLQHYKNKFHPRWEPRYIAFQQPWDWASALVASARLVQARSRADRRRIAAARVGRRN